MSKLKSFLSKMLYVRWVQMVVTSKIFMPIFRKYFINYDLTDDDIKNALKYGIDMDSYIVYDFDRYDITHTCLIEK